MCKTSLGLRETKRAQAKELQAKELRATCQELLGFKGLHGAGKSVLNPPGRMQLWQSPTRCSQCAAGFDPNPTSTKSELGGWQKNSVKHCKALSPKRIRGVTSSLNL